MLQKNNPEAFAKFEYQIKQYQATMARRKNPDACPPVQTANALLTEYDALVAEAESHYEQFPWK